MGSRIMFNLPFRIETFDDNDKKLDLQDQSPQSIKIVKLHPKYNLHLIVQTSIYNMINDYYNTVQWN
jgi:hypothetical protein